MITIILLVFSGSAYMYNLENNIGLYKVIRTDCQLSQGLYNPCKDIRFVELVKGKFYGIRPDQLAIVFWRVGKKPDELQYETHLIGEHFKKKREENRIWVKNQTGQNETEREYFLLKNENIVSYHYHLFQINNAGQKIVRRFNYTLQKVTRKEFPKLKLNYPSP
jgi:hypothetical protein